MKEIKTMTINPSSISVIEGSSYNDLVVQIEPSDADNQVLLWSSDDSEIASVSPELGCIYGNKEGQTIIRATATDGSGVSAFCTVNIEPRIYVQSITLNRTSMTIGKGEAWQLSADISPEDAFDKSITWCSSNCWVADVDSNGIVTGKAVGTAEIYATARDGSEATACCTVTVRQTSTCSTKETPKNSVKASYLSVPVDVYSGAHRLKHTLMKLFGGQGLNFSISYDSTRLVKGDVGIGWYHNYEKHIEIFEDFAHVYSAPSVYSKYIAKSAGSTRFECSSADKNGYVLTIDESAGYPYMIDCNSQRKEYYDCNGDLVYVVDHREFAIKIVRKEHIIVITDMINNKKIYVEKDSSGKIFLIYDDALRNVFLNYTNDLLTSITDVNGNTFKYTYDISNCIKTGIDPMDIQYFVNTYDEYGRLTEQSDALENSFKFAYDGNKRIITDRNGKQSTR